MADGTSGAEALPVCPTRFGTVVVVGGGCYGSYYVRQLGRAVAAGAATVEQVIVVDRDPRCQVVRDPPADAAVLPWHLACADWRGWFAEWLPTRGEGGRHDTIVPSPLMPHLFFEWLLDRAATRWPSRQVALGAVPAPPSEIPWQRGAPDGRHYVSYATWSCPINCIEPARCPHTRGRRDWSLPETLARWGQSTPRAFTDVLTFHCAHRTYGVGMVDVDELLAADRAVAGRGEGEPAVFLVGTVSHCHGALAVLHVD
jgi:hypothetical protein